MSSTFSLRCVHPPFIRFQLTHSAAVIGRSSECDLVLDEPSVSRRHARVRLSKSELCVFDLNSRNGTFIDDVRIEQGTAFSDQRVRFGKVTFTLVSAKLQPLQGSPEEEETDIPSVGCVAEDPCRNLSVAQRRVFELLLSGHPEKTISRKLNLSRHTIHTHTMRIFKILKVHSRAELIASFLRTGHG